MNANRSNDMRKIFLPKKSIKSLAILAALLLCFLYNPAQAQEATSPQKVSEPVDPIREKQKEAYFKKLEQTKNTSIKKPENQENISVEPLPIWNDTGNFETDKASYLLAIAGWLERNASLYNSEDLEFLNKPILKVENRERNLKNN